MSLTRRITGKYHTYFLICFLCLGIAAVGRRLEPVMVAVPFFVSLIMVLGKPTRPRLDIAPREGGEHVFAEDEIESGFQIDAHTDLPLLEAVEVLPLDAQVVSGTNSVVASLRGGESRDFAFTFRIPSRRSLGNSEVVVRLRDRTGFLQWEGRIRQTEPRVVFPRPYRLAHLIAPEHTQVYSGNYPSRVHGEGIEYADIRAFAPGDKADRINWKAVARTGRLYVNDFVIERNTDIVLLLDVFADMRTGAEGLLDTMSRGVATLAYHYLAGKNRVGLIEFGVLLSYLAPQPGHRQWYRILSRLARTQTVRGYVSFQIQNIPRRILPARALVIAMTGMLDERFSRALLDIKHRGFDTAVIHVPAPEMMGQLLEGRRLPADVRTAMRLWDLVCRRKTASLTTAGLDVVSWLPSMPFDLVLSRLNLLRRERGRRR